MREGRWHLLANDELQRVYSTDDLRLSVVYRARCFANERERLRYMHQRRPRASYVNAADMAAARADDVHNDMMQLDDVLGKLKDELVRRGRVGTRAELDALRPLDLAMRLMDEYVKYPLSEHAHVPFNYCALKHSALQAILDEADSPSASTSSEAYQQVYSQLSRLVKKAAANAASLVLDAICDD